MKATGLLLDPVFLLHDTGPGHPESMHRYTALLHKLAPGGNVEHYDAFNDIRNAFYEEQGLDPLPASTCIQAALCRPELLVEIEAIAIIPKERGR